MSEVVCRVTRQMLAGNGTFITLSGAKYQTKILGETRGKNIVSGHWPRCHHRRVTSGGILGPDMSSCVRIDLNHLSMHEHSRRRVSGESFEEK